MMIHLIRLTLIAAVLMFAIAGCKRADSHANEHDQGSTVVPSHDEDHESDEIAHDEDEHDDHEGHDHAAVDEEDEHEDHEGHDHALVNEEDEHDDHEGHDHGASDAANLVELSPIQQERLGLKFATAQAGAIDVTCTFPGEIILNPERMAHIVPRAAGVVREVTVSLGDFVREGDIIAWIESDELAEAKLAFYASYTEVGCCEIELPRMLEIFENTNSLLTLLESEPTSEELQEFTTFEMGEYRGLLLTAYSEYLATKNTFESERELFGKNISSERELIEAEAAFKKAQAEFEAAKDTARYQVLIDYTEAAGDRQVAEFAAVAAEQRLRLKGVDDEVLSQLRALVPQTTGFEPCLCDDPNCGKEEIPSVLDTLGNEKRLGWYALRAPFAGYITEKHLTLGEKVSDEESVMTIADTSTVWVRFGVYQKDLSLVVRGQEVRIDPGVGIPSVTGSISYVSPIVDKDTRTAQARVMVSNPDGDLRPGLYATVQVSVESVDVPVIIFREAVQVLDNEEVVFIEDGDGFIPVPVILGKSDRDRVTVLSGLEPGQRYVRKGAFEMKAHIVTSGLDPHAGHGH